MTDRSVPDEVVDLDAIEESAGRVRIRGVEYNVLPLNGDGWRLLQEMAAAASTNDGARVLAMAGRVHDIVKQLLPDMAPEAVDKLGFKQCTAVVQIAIGQIEAVRAALEEQFGDPTTPTDQTSPSPSA